LISNEIAQLATQTMYGIPELITKIFIYMFHKGKVRQFKVMFTWSWKWC